MTTERGSTGLMCPKCGAEMRSYERNNVTIDQCTQCRGIFLDRGELEQLIEQETSYFAGGGGARMRDDDDYRRGGEHGDSRRGGEHGDSRWGGEHGDSRGGKRRGGFLGNLFD